MPSRWKLSNGSNSYILLPNDLCSTYHSLYQENSFPYISHRQENINYCMVIQNIPHWRVSWWDIDLFRQKEGEKKCPSQWEHSHKISEFHVNPTCEWGLHCSCGRAVDSAAASWHPVWLNAFSTLLLLA